MNIVAIVPARSDSKGIPNKNMRPFNGRPLIHYAIELAREAEKRDIIADHIVSTDNEEIASVAKEMGANVPFIRPPELATDESAVVETVIHAMRWWEQHNNDVFHSVLLLQPTNPLTVLSDIENSTKYYLNNQPDAKCLISVCDARHVRLSTLYHKRGGYLEQALKKANPLVRRQDLRKLYWRNGSIYISRRDLLLREGKILNNNPLFYEMPRERSVPIDDMFDWALAESLIKCNNSS